MRHGKNTDRESVQQILGIQVRCSWKKVHRPDDPETVVRYQIKPLDSMCKLMQTHSGLCGSACSRSKQLSEGCQNEEL